MTEKNNSSTLDSDKISNQKNHLPSNKNKHSSKISLESPIQSEQSNYNIDSLTFFKHCESGIKVLLNENNIER